MFILVFALILLFSTVAHAEVIGQTGSVYSIKEPDAYEELMNRVKSVNWNAVFGKMKAFAQEATKVDFHLKHAKLDRTFTVDPTYTLEFDITDEKGNVLYPKGYSFNPLHYMQFPYVLVFFDAQSVEEIKWAKQYTGRWDVLFIATRGDTSRAAKQLQRHVYAANEKMIKKFKLSATPSVVYAQNGVLIVSEVGIYGKSK
ncbi:hypothetical protein [Thermodesulfovibrio yellowstonii]|uniref:hypothetical protein n=1 Tax=Thermodesulfovibrio yellowstonii TaxID=28262 RepID=UPI0004132884|nr:hypothetical protein [Thermodesulfovibrio islandicus]